MKPFLSLSLLVALLAAPALGANPFSRWQSFPQDDGFFPIGVWTQNPRDAGEYKKLGVNFYFGLWGGPTAAQIAELKKNGMGGVCGFNDYAKENLLDDPTVWGWMHGDEPDLAHHYPRKLLKGPGGKDIIKEHWPEIYKELDLDHNEYNGWGLGLHPVNDVQADYKAIKRNDPSRPVFIQLSKAVALNGVSMGRGDRSGKTWEYPLYLEGSDAVSFDIYPVAYGDPDKLWQVADGVDQLKKWGAGDRPLMVALECGFGETWANKHQQRAELWMAINHGANGFFWFVHRWTKQDGKEIFYSDRMPLTHPEIGQEIKELNEEVLSLASVINSEPLPDAVSVSGAEIDFSARRQDDSLYVFAVERGGKGGAASLQLADVEGAKVEVLGENRTISCQDGIFKDDFSPWEVHLYKITP